MTALSASRPSALPDSPDERWRPIPAWEGLYEVSDHGRIYSVPRFITTRAGVKKRVGGRVLRGGLASNGRDTVTLHDSSTGRVETTYPYIAVLTAFVAARPVGCEGRHLNGDCRDNRLTNLAWGTHRENVQDMLRHGTKVEQTRTHCPRQHPLTAPNLKPNKPRGQRECLACARARTYLRSAEPGFSAARFREQADLELQILMGAPHLWRPRCYGEYNAHAIMTDAKVSQLRSERADGASTAELAERYGIARPTVLAIVSRRLWKHVP